MQNLLQVCKFCISGYFTNFHSGSYSALRNIIYVPPKHSSQVITRFLEAFIGHLDDYTASYIHCVFSCITFCIIAHLADMFHPYKFSTGRLQEVQWWYLLLLCLINLQWTSQSSKKTEVDLWNGGRGWFTFSMHRCPSSVYLLIHQECPHTITMKLSTYFQTALDTINRTSPSLCTLLSRRWATFHCFTGTGSKPSQLHKPPPHNLFKVIFSWD